jgi:hypothetical protein
MRSQAVGQARLHLAWESEQHADRRAAVPRSACPHVRGHGQDNARTPFTENASEVNVVEPMLCSNVLHRGGREYARAGERIEYEFRYGYLGTR